MKEQNDPESKIRAWLDEIKDGTQRNPAAARRARAVFMSQAVSANELLRHKGWKFNSGKEQFAMNVLLSIVVIAALLFGGGMTVNAAQNDLPNEPLYAVKIWTEDLGMQFQNTGETKANRLMELSRIRVQEMEGLIEAGEPIPDQVRLRLEQHVQQALQTCLTLDDTSFERTLLRIRDRLQEQDRELDRLQLQTQNQLQQQTKDQLRQHTQEQLQALTQTRLMLRERLRLVEVGLLDPEMFRERVRNGFRFGQEELTPPGQNGNGPQNNQPGIEPNITPGGPNPEPGGQNTNPGEPNPNPGGPNSNPGGSNPDPGGPNSDPGGSNPDPGGPNSDPGGPNNDPGGNGNGP